MDSTWRKNLERAKQNCSVLYKRCDKLNENLFTKTKQLNLKKMLSNIEAFYAYTLLNLSE